MKAPTMTPGTVPASSSRVSGPFTSPARPYLNNAPGPAITLYSRLVGVTAGLGTPSTLNWIGSMKTAPETPTGAVTVATTTPAAKPKIRCATTKGP